MPHSVVCQGLVAWICWKVIQQIRAAQAGMRRSYDLEVDASACRWLIADQCATANAIACAGVPTACFKRGRQHPHPTYHISVKKRQVGRGCHAIASADVFASCCAVCYCSLLWFAGSVRLPILGRRLHSTMLNSTLSSSMSLPWLLSRLWSGIGPPQRSIQMCRTWGRH